MKTSVRFLVMLLAIVVIVGAAITASAIETPTSDNDEALELLIDLGIIGGYEDGSIRPNQAVTRAEMAKITYVLYTTFQTADNFVEDFSDVAKDHWAAGYISWSANRGIVGGHGDGTFKPNDNVTYDQALKMVCGTLGYTEWDSNLWPTDVRRKGIVDLKLGKNLEGIKGETLLTRAQVARMVYNSLFADMNEVREEYNPDNPFLPAKVMKNLAVDVWGFKYLKTPITAAGDIGETVITVKGIDITAEGLGDFTLEELELEQYEDSLDDLLYANLAIFYRPRYSADGKTELAIVTDNIHAASIELTATKDVTVTYDKAKSRVLVNDENKLDNNAQLLTVNSLTGVATLTTFTKNDVPNFGTNDKFPYAAIVYDTDSDGDYDIVTYDYLEAMQVTEVTRKTISLERLNEPGVNDLNNRKLEEVISAVELKEDDVVVVTRIFKDVVVTQVVSPIMANAVKYSTESITFSDGATYTTGERVFKDNAVGFNVSASVMDTNKYGQTQDNQYYIYDGKVLSNNTLDEGLKFAILSYIKTPPTPTFNSEDNRYETSYKALLVIDGVETEVDLDPANAIDGKSMLVKGSADYNYIINNYGEKYTADGTTFTTTVGKYLVKQHKLVTYKVDASGLYSLYDINTLTGTNERHSAGVKLVYDYSTKLYHIEDTTGSLVSGVSILFNENSKLYYSYTKPATGYYTYLGTKVEDDLPVGFEELTFVSDVYLDKDEDTNLFRLVAGVIDNETIVANLDSRYTYKEDARLVNFCYKSSDQQLASDGKNLHYVNYMMPLNGSKNGGVVDTENFVGAGVAAPVRGGLYVWDDTLKQYCQVTKSSLSTLGINCIDSYVISDITDGIIFTTEGKYTKGFKVDSETVLWSVQGYENVFSITFEEIVQLFEDLKLEGKELKIIVGTYKNADNEEVVCTVYVQWWRTREYDGSHDNSNYTTELITKFNS